MGVVKCDNCKKEFNVTEYKIKKNKHNFCCRNCYLEFVNKQKEILECDYCHKKYYKKNYTSYNTKKMNRKHNFCSRQCYINFVKEEAIKNKNKNKIKLKCENCNKIFFRHEHRIKGNKSNKFFCSIECFNQWRKKDINSIITTNPNAQSIKKQLVCDNCHKKFIGRFVKGQKHYFCSRECKIAFQSRLNCECDYCHKKFHRSEKLLKNSNHHFCSRTCFEKYEKQHPEFAWNYNLTKGDPRVMAMTKKITAKVKAYYNNLSEKDKKERYKNYSKKMSKVMTKFFKNLKGKEREEYFRLKNINNNNSPNIPEKIVIDVIKKYNLPYKFVGDGKFWIEDMNPDFINTNGKKECLEVFGNFWHNPNKINLKFKRTYQGRKYYMKKYGFNCIILWEKQIKKNGEQYILKKLGVENEIR